MLAKINTKVKLRHSGRAGRGRCVVRHDAREALAAVLSKFRFRARFFSRQYDSFRRDLPRVRKTQVFRNGVRVRDQKLLCAIGLSLVLGAAEACAAGVTPGRAIIEIASDQNSGHVIHDLGVLQPAANSDNPIPTPSSAATVNSAEPIPELPTWAMMLLCLIGLGLARLKKGRKDRLSPGIE